MKTTRLANFSEKEHALNENLNALFRDWSDFLLSIGFWEKYDIDYFVTDGIFPGYLAQRFKVLFIGKESLDIAGQSYIDILYNAIHEKQIGGTFVNQSHFFRRMLKTAYGINHGLPEWEGIPDAAKLAETFGNDGGVSFAFMNLSKLSHEYLDNSSWQADMPTITEFVEQSSRSPRNFFREQMEIIHPDIVITMNLRASFPSLGDIRILDETIPDIEVCSIALGEREVPLFNTWHFAAMKSDAEHFYAPLCAAIKKYVR